MFTRKQVAGKMRIRSQKYDLARIVKHILGFDANSLYPSTMAKDMPRGKEFVEHYEDPLQAAKDLIPRMYSKRWFGFAEVDIKVPRDLWEKFEEFPPIFINQSVGAEGIPQHMKDYLQSWTERVENYLQRRTNKDYNYFRASNTTPPPPPPSQCWSTRILQ